MSIHSTLNFYVKSSEIIFRLAKEHNSDFSKVAITNQIASVIASLIPALVLRDAEEGSGGENELIKIKSG